MKENYKNIIEAALFAAGEPLNLQRLQYLFAEEETPLDVVQVKALLEELKLDYVEKGIELVEVASGYRFQVKEIFSHSINRLWEKKMPRYSRALLETLALIAYRQPITRAEIEEIRGVAVSSHIMKILQEREWIKVVGTRDVPGKPALFGTTKIFLDYFNLKKLSDLPPLKELLDLDKAAAELNEQLALPMGTTIEVVEPIAEAVAEDLENILGGC